MKPDETKSYRKYSIVMILCFITGGSCLLLYFSSLFMSFGFFRFFNGSSNMNSSNNSAFNNSQPGPPGMFASFAINDTVVLIAGIILIAAGIALYLLINEKKAASLKKDITHSLLTPEEKTVLEILEKKGGESTQKEITALTEMSKVKVFRTTRILEEKGLIHKAKYGQTRKIILK